MNSLKVKWAGLDRPIQIGVAAAAVVIALLFVFKALPYLITAMGFGVLFAILFVPYWVPTIVAFVRKHPNRGAILALNLLAGWSFIGWVIALVWALGSATSQNQTVIVNTTVAASGVFAPQPVYRVGDTVNGHRFDGQTWTPVAAPPAVPADLAPPVSMNLNPPLPVDDQTR